MKNKKIGIYPGTFDPITFGHFDIILRSLKIVDMLIIAVTDNSNKTPLFPIKNRIQMLNQEITKIHKNYRNKIKIDSFDGLLTKYAKKNKVTCIIRGLRAVSDFDYEFQMTGMNYHLNPDIDTIFLMASEKYSFISSNFVKEVHKLGGKVDKFVSKFVVEELNKRNI